MKKTIKFVALGVMNTLTTVAFAHEGHGLSGLHAHATDLVNALIWFVAIAAVFYAFKGKK